MLSKTTKTLLSTSIAALALAGCNSSNSGGGSGSLSLDITDAPIDSATEVRIVFTGVEIQKSNNGARTVIEFDEPKSINLLDLQGGVTEPLLESETLAAGDYSWIRLKMDADQGGDSYIMFGDAQYDLFIPSGAQTGLKLVQGFTIPANGEASFTIDFDLRKSIVEPKGAAVANYFLKPALRLVDNSLVGHIAGTVSSTVVTANCSGAVYVYEGADITPGDVGGEGVEPLASALVDTDQTGVTEFEYKVAFLVEGEYTAAFTCDAGMDDPEEADDLNFIGTQNVIVEAGATAEANF